MTLTRWRWRTKNGIQKNFSGQGFQKLNITDRQTDRHTHASTQTTFPPDICESAFSISLCLMHLTCVDKAPSSPHQSFATARKLELNTLFSFQPVVTFSLYSVCFRTTSLVLCSAMLMHSFPALRMVETVLCMWFWRTYNQRMLTRSCRQKTAYEMATWLEFRRVLFRSRKWLMRTWRSFVYTRQMH